MRFKRTKICPAIKGGALRFHDNNIELQNYEKGGLIIPRYAWNHLWMKVEKVWSVLGGVNIFSMIDQFFNFFSL